MAKLKRMINEFSILNPDVAYFILVYDEGSINKSARKISQDPAHISRSIARLERNLGDQLFFRHKNGLKPTELADRFYISVTGAQQEYSSRIGLKSHFKTSLRIGFSPAIGYMHLSRPMMDAIHRFNFSPEFILASSIEIIEMVKSRDIDFALVHSAVKFPGVISKPIAEEGVVLCSIAAKESSVLVLHPDMLALERIVQAISYQSRWTIKDYFVLAKILENDPDVMGLLPEGVFRMHPKLKAIRVFPNEGKITAVSWPGSPGVDILKCLVK